ncbi:sn-glycerol-3-phosphate ABC transporter ATP-binding protein UgpC [Aestuariivirga sp.]|uniref:ABC transporter ATP-binding protein n=1 Tax=Aestuariivirga sp. TaxID=2650926 RepID=UPI0025BADFA2|nr:sn-glycerol-3-phosphate ABC transporter ATP-binding protein UgpC [Aestuariivirga sp.]MCA3555517.1 sn-glycerol-3-phosphate ABC transporter ATP-binding protein UgpC [Aestuariivirga sp.]
MATLQLENLKKSFGTTHVLKGVDLSLASGEMLVIVGASGCGKSTLLRLVAGLETPTSGQIMVDGRDVAQLDPAQRDIAMVFQNYALYPHMTVFDNMAYGLRIRGLSREDIGKRVQDAANTLGLGALLKRTPRQLSGGQRQRVAMGRAIVREPKVFLFDEPLSNLDAALRVQMRAEIRRLQRRMRVTSLYVTHDQVEAMTLGDRLLVMHLGKPVQLATPMEVFEKPANTYVAGFIGAPSMNLMPAKLGHGGASAVLEDGHVITFADGRRPGQDGRKLTVGIRPEHLRPEPGGIEIFIDLVEPLGSETVVIGRMKNGELVSVKIPSAGSIPETMSVVIAPEHLHVFDGETGLRVEAV